MRSHVIPNRLRSLALTVALAASYVYAPAGLALAILLALPIAAAAQVGSATDILTGVVYSPDGRPLEGATIEATSIETNITRRARSGSNGRYTIVFPDGGGQYRMRTLFLGMAPQEFVLVRQADEDRLVRDVKMSLTPVSIGGVTVRAPRRRPGEDERPTPGATGRTITGEQAARLPIDASDLNELALLAPGVIPIAGSDTTAAGFSIAGLPSTQNSITVDGLSFGSTSLPQDAVRSTRVITNTYDVARGQFTGAQVATTTKSGSNIPTGSFTYSLRDRDLAFGGDQSSAFSRGFTQNQLGGGFGGPLVHDKLFAFGSIQGRRRTSAVTSLLQANQTTLQRLGANSDSVTGFLGMVQDLGLPLEPDAFDPNTLADNASALLRLDYLFAENHTLMLRGDWRWSETDPTRLGSLSLPATAGQQAGHGGGLMATLTSRFGTIINELRAYGSIDHRNASPYIDLPQGRVQIASTVGDSARAISTLVFGGNPSLPTFGTTKLLESSDEVSWLPGDASHRIKLGGLVNVQRFEQDATTNRGGTFSYLSLADFESGRPSQYTRTLAPQLREGTAINPAIYLGDTWRQSRALQLNYGMRLEGATFQGAPAENPRVDSIFGLRTDRFPSELHASPRAGFTLTLGGTPANVPGMPQGGGGGRGGGGRGGFGGGGNFGGGPATTIIRGGFGEFRSPSPTGLYSSAQGATGIDDGEQQLVCVGAGVPVPDWSNYLTDPGSVPTTCAFGASPVARSARPSVTAFAPEFGAPRAWRGSLGIQRRLFDRYSASVDAGIARGTSLPSATDLNLARTPQFTLASEGNRPIYVPAASIVPASGAEQFFASRVDPSFGHVFELASNLRSHSEQLTFALNGVTTHGLIFQASYTWLRARDQSSFTCCAATQALTQATTAGDPNVREWGPSDNDRRHSFLLTATYPVTSSLELTTIGRLISGSPFTPIVGSDLNGDGLRNDRAFIFSPSVAADTAIANAMARVLRGAGGAGDAVRQCITQQLGTIAGRNSCEGPWQPSLDLQLNLRPTAFGLDRRLTFSALTVNLLGGIDQLLHGANGVRGWGMFTRPDPTLLYVRGFDPATNAFKYQVNERFGATGGTALAFRTPFQVAFQLRYTVGPDQVRDRLRGLFGAGGTRARGGAGGGDFSDRFARLVPNPVTRLIGMKDTLSLTDSQVVRLTALRDSLDAKNAPIADSIRAAVQRAGTGANPGALMNEMRPRLQTARTNAQQALDAAHALLSEEQWAKVPESAKRVGGFGGGPGGRRPQD